MIKKLQNIDNKWFYSDNHTLIKLLSIFVKGDFLVLVPLLFLIILTSLISMRFMFILLGTYIAVRYLGEMIYWLLQQFGEKKYRPYDFGFKNLDNNAVYILYQTLSIAGIMLGVSLLVYFLV